MKKTYKKDDLIINWQPEKCIHSTKCWKGVEGLMSVFNPMEKPWIKPENESKERIIEQIKKCPSGALSYDLMNSNEPVRSNKSASTIVEVTQNGPLLVHGKIQVKHNDAIVEKLQTTALCRCGASKNKPYCDGQHRAIGFEG
jgi:uncharacterized Fe-S cluster protein YjdI